MQREDFLFLAVLRTVEMKRDSGWNRDTGERGQETERAEMAFLSLLACRAALTFASVGTNKPCSIP